jgi:ABC-2 type transport system ATP-binding protein
MTDVFPMPLQTRSLVKIYGDDVAVDRVDLQVAPGEIHAIVGLNGAGKTTLMRTLLGMVKPTAGEALVMGHSAQTAEPRVWMEVGCLIETPFAYPELTVRENLRAAALLHGLAPGRINSAVDRVLCGFELSVWEHKRSRTLSLGNRQRLGLASAVIHEPSILVLDEPANALDPAGVVFIRDLLRAASNGGAAILVSSHHLDQLARVADRITMMHRGMAVGSLDPDGIDLEQQFFDRVYRVEMERGAA